MKGNLRGLPTVFVYEHITGGGLAGQMLPRSLAAEGTAMRRALASDFSRIEGIDVVMALDARLPDDTGPWSVVRIGPGEFEAVLEAWIDAAAAILCVAPETDGVLGDLVGRLARTGGARSLNAEVAAIRHSTDKHRLAWFWKRVGVRTPAARIVPPDSLLPFPPVRFAPIGTVSPWSKTTDLEPEPGDEWIDYPLILKPIDGAGMRATYLLSGPDDGPPRHERTSPMLIQPWVSGEPMSASYLVGAGGEIGLVGVTRQRIDLRPGQLHYQGGIVEPDVEPGESVLRAVASIAGLRGWVGVDFVRTAPDPIDIVIEVNPRPTTSYVGLRRLFPPGELARVWWSALVAGKPPPPRLQPTPNTVATRVRFDADGTIRQESVLS